MMYALSFDAGGNLDEEIFKIDYGITYVCDLVVRMW